LWKVKEGREEGSEVGKMGKEVDVENKMESKSKKWN
jgi:hypothetical protein